MLRTSVRFGGEEEPTLKRTNSSPAAYALDRHSKAMEGHSTLKWSASGAAAASSAPGELLVVIDFDCTLTLLHMHETLNGDDGQTALHKDPAAFYLEVFGGSERLEKLRAFLTGLRDAGATVYLLSNGYETDLDPALEATDLHDLFDRIIGFDSINAVACVDKTAMLVQFAVELAGRLPSGVTQILYADDNRGNFPGEGDTQIGDTWKLAVTSGSQLAVPRVELVAWPAGEKQNGTGLDAGAMDAMLARVLSATAT